MTQKIPERLEIIDVMPRNPSGKVPKHELAHAHRSGLTVGVQVSLTISGFTRLFDGDLRAVLDAAPRGRRRRLRPADAARPRGDGAADRSLSVRDVPLSGRGTVARADDVARRDRGGHGTGAARDRHPHLAVAARRPPREDGGDARRR